MVKNPPAKRIRSLGWEDTLEEEMATHCGTLAWVIHGQRSPVGYSPGGGRIRHDLATKRQKQPSGLVSVKRIKSFNFTDSLESFPTSH